MKCNVSYCEKEAVDLHGIVIVTHGYCFDHRTCNKCGLRINYECKCKIPVERELLEACVCIKNIRAPGI